MCQGSTAFWARPSSSATALAAVRTGVVPDPGGVLRGLLGRLGHGGQVGVARWGGHSARLGRIGVVGLVVGKGRTAFGARPGSTGTALTAVRTGVVPDPGGVLRGFRRGCGRSIVGRDAGRRGSLSGGVVHGGIAGGIAVVAAGSEKEGGTEGQDRKDGIKFHALFF